MSPRRGHGGPRAAATTTITTPGRSGVPAGGADGWPVGTLRAHLQEPSAEVRATRIALPRPLRA